MSNNVTVYLRGETSYAKILGEPMPNYSKDGFEWKMDLKITPGDIKTLKSAGVSDRVKMKPEYLGGAPYLTLKVRSERTDVRTGEKIPNDPPRVVDKAGEAWNDKKLIGNGSVVDVKLAVRDYGEGKKKGVYLQGVRVMKLIPYLSDDFAPVDETDEFYEANEFRKDFGLDALDDEIIL